MGVKIMDFHEWYHEEWIQHISDSGGIKAQIKLLTWMVGAILAADMAIIGWLLVSAG